METGVAELLERLPRAWSGKRERLVAWAVCGDAADAGDAAIGGVLAEKRQAPAAGRERRAGSASHGAGEAAGSAWQWSAGTPGRRRRECRGGRLCASRTCVTCTAMDVEVFLDDFATRCFRDTADGDYIAARLSYRAGLTMQYLWSSQQAIEKYFKCILLLNRTKATDVRHDLGAALKRIEANINLGLTSRSKEFIAHIDSCAQCRYLEISWFAFGREIIDLDRVVWELRRFCTRDTTLRSVALHDGCAAPKLRIHGGYLEKILDNPNHPARAPLLWQNGFIGKKRRRRVRVWKGFTFVNSPLYLFPQFVDEVAKYVLLPKPLQAAYRDAAREKKLRADDTP